MCFPFCVTVDLSSQTSGSGMAFQGLLYAASYDHLAIPLMPRDNISMVSLSSDLLEEVKNVLIPAEMLRIEDSQIIGKGEPLLSLTSVCLFVLLFFLCKFITTIFPSYPGHFGTVYHGYLIDSNKQETHCAVKSLNRMLIQVLSLKSAPYELHNCWIHLYALH